MHPQLRKSYVPLSCPSLVVFWPSSINWQSGVWVHSFIDVYYSCGPSCHSIPEWLGETNSSTPSISRIGSKQLCFEDQSLIQLLFYSTLKYCHLYIKNVMGIAHQPTNSWYSDTSRRHYSFLGSRVVATVMLICELWCVKSILLATLLLGS